MQRLSIDPANQGEELWIEPDPEGEFVRADEAQDEINNIRANIAAFSAWLDSEHEEGSCPEFRAAIRKVREAFSELV